MGKFVSIALCLIPLVNSNMKAQDSGRYWCFGDSAGIDFSNLSMPVPVFSFMDTPYSSASLGDSLGLLMYAHTRYWPLFIQNSRRTTVVRNRYHGLMQNGDSLIADGSYNGLTFINKPGFDSLYYLFQWGFSVDAGLYYSVVDPYYNNDSGIVIEKNVKLNLADDNIDNAIFAIRHGNGRDWWIITRFGTASNRFSVFYVGVDSIAGPIDQNIGTITPSNTNTLSVSKLGDQLCLVSQTGIVEIYNFDRCTGIISNPLPINIPFSTQFFGSEFSPNGQVLYISTTDNIFFGDSLRLFQIDLSVPNPSSAVEVLYTVRVPASGGNLRRGPDDKIYLTCLHDSGWPYQNNDRNLYNENLSVINYPDSIGLACDFMPFSFYLGGKRTYWSLPNNANFNLGELTGSACDSLTLSAPEIKKDLFEIFPNPASAKVSFIFENDTEREIHLFDVYGRNVISKTAKDRYVSVDISSLVAGTYYIRVSGGITSKILILR